MDHRLRLIGLAVATVLIPLSGAAQTQGNQNSLPAFGRDTVLVWRIENQGETANFVVRVAEFQPNRFIEWEDASTQGTVYMSEKAVATARIFLNARLFESGVDTKGKDATTLWLSRKAFADLKAKGRLKLAIDSVDCWISLEGNDSITVEVNRTPVQLPVLHVKDERGSDRWFLDSEDNPLMVRHVLRKYDQTLASITTDRQNTLRWIKGKKLTGPH